MSSAAAAQEARCSCSAERLRLPELLSPRLPQLLVLEREERGAEERGAEEEGPPAAACASACAF
jgi:hypothetical protein